MKEQVKVRLTKDHLHNGQECKAGRILQVSRFIADFLIQLKKAKKV